MVKGILSFVGNFFKLVMMLVFAVVLGVFALGSLNR